MWWKWFPWRWIIRRAAKAHGFIDPVVIRSRLHRFAQPSEVMEPIELLRAGMIFHARGLINTRAIQHNLDWVWPYWVDRQFNPEDVAFIPRSFSITHVNLTHRNWTAVGLPDVGQTPIVDPRGLVTPFWDGWSLDGWLFSEDGRTLLPSRIETVTQVLSFEEGLSVQTEAASEGLRLTSQVEVAVHGESPFCRIRLRAQAEREGWAVVSLRPYNPEGVSFIHDIVINAERTAWTVDTVRRVFFDPPADRFSFSDYRHGDVYRRLAKPSGDRSVRCEVGMATAAALFRLPSGGVRDLEISVPLDPWKEGSAAERSARPASERWKEIRQGLSTLQIPDARYHHLYEAALRTLVLLSPDEVYPGPYTYRRFWFRDAAFILHAMLCVGMTERAERAMDRFPNRQTASGYFLSQEGEWDSNGAVLWLLYRHLRLTGRQLPPRWRKVIARGGRWIVRKRHSDRIDAPHAGLLPAGFSAEHLGPNDHYYWDDFWGVAGLRSAADLMDAYGAQEQGDIFRREAGLLMEAVERSLERTAPRRDQPGIPASPYRRMDSGAIGSLAAGYPLHLWPPEDKRLLDTVEFLLRYCRVGGGFFQDMIHSGINPYLTLHLAQVLLRAGDRRCFELADAVAKAASPTGQWPEAIHPRTGGGCMGDGQHAWASAEWILYLRNSFVREEGERLILGSGIPRGWLSENGSLSFGPTPTPHGPITVRLDRAGREIQVRWEADWREKAPPLEVRLPGLSATAAAPGDSAVTVSLPEGE